MLQKIEASLQQLVAQPSVSAETLRQATSQVNLFFGSFRKADADDPETFTAGCTRLFTAYHPDVVRYVVDPVTGLPGRSEWLPSLKKVKEALDERAGYIARLQAAAERERVQLEERKREERERAPRPTLDELKQQYGESWGLSVEANTEKLKETRRASMHDANRRTFIEECDAAGVDPNLGVSPSLLKLLRKDAA